MNNELETEETFEADNAPLSLSDKGERETVAEERDDKQRHERRLRSR